MKKRIKLTDGFKFSFKDVSESSRSTPKFTSIQLQPNQISYLKPKQISKKKLEPFNQRRKQQQLINGKMKKSTIHTKIKSYTIAQQTFSNFEELDEKKFASLISQKKERHRKIAHSTPIIKQSQKQQKQGMLKSKIIFQKGKKQTVQKSQRKQKTKSQDDLNSYLQIFKREKQEKQQKKKPKQLNLSFKKQVSLLDILEKQGRIQSPKLFNSVQSAKNAHRKMHTIQTQYFQKHEEIQIVNPSIFPQTEKSKKILNANFTEDKKFQKHNFFAAFKKNQNKRSDILSRALFKAKKINIEDKLNLLATENNAHIDQQ